MDVYHQLSICHVHFDVIKEFPAPECIVPFLYICMCVCVCVYIYIYIYSVKVGVYCSLRSIMINIVIT